MVKKRFFSILEHVYVIEVAADCPNVLFYVLHAALVEAVLILQGNDLFSYSALTWLTHRNQN